jgi:hypothetical protein
MSTQIENRCAEAQTPAAHPDVRVTIVTASATAAAPQPVGERYRTLGLVCLGVTVALGYFLLRSQGGLHWDDSADFCAIRYDRLHRYADEAHLLTALLRDAFSQVEAAGYRPLTFLQHRLAAWLAVEEGVSPMAWYALGGGALGLLAICYYLVARRFTATAAGALLATFLLLFSAPVITGALPVLFNIQALVPLTICTGLLLYWRLTETQKHRGLYAAGLCAVLFLGPWVREFIGILPLLIGWLELQRARRPTWIMGLAAVGFVHALFPTALLAFTLLPDLPVKPVYAIGTLGARMNAPVAAVTLLGRLQALKWDVPYHFLSLYPPLLLVLASAGGALAALTPVSARRSMAPRRLGSLVLPSVYLLSALALACVNQEALGMNLLSLWLALGVAVIALQTDSFLAVWFALSFLPFLKVFTEQVHLAYALLPASIALARTIERLHTALAGPRWWRAALRYLFVAMLSVALLDHGLNLYGTCRAVAAMDEAVTRTAGWFREHVPAGSAVVSNALHLEDIRLASANHIASFWTVAAGIPRNEGALDDTDRLARFLRDRQGKSDVYFLDVDFNYAPDKVRYHSHKYVRNHSVAMESLGKIHVLQARYPYLDPLKRIVPRHFISFLGPPDLENDYYRGPAQDGTPLMREVYAEYHVYRVTGTDVK